VFAYASVGNLKVRKASSLVTEGFSVILTNFKYSKRLTGYSTMRHMEEFVVAKGEI
jgi:hypothetical protein